MNVNVSERKGYVIPTASKQWVPFPFAKWLPSVSEYTCPAGEGACMDGRDPTRGEVGTGKRGWQARRSLICQLSDTQGGALQTDLNEQVAFLHMLGLGTGL